MSSAVKERGSGWITYAGIMLIIIGFLDIVNGLWAIDHHNTSPASSQLMYGNLKAWGWVMILWGVVVVLSATLVFGRIQLGRWIGIIAATITMILNMSWVVAYPLAGFTVILLCALVLYGLIVYGGPEETA
jgi:hypothetical protein